MLIKTIIYQTLTVSKLVHNGLFSYFKSHYVLIAYIREIVVSVVWIRYRNESLFGHSTEIYHPRSFYSIRKIPEARSDSRRSINSHMVFCSLIFIWSMYSPDRNTLHAINNEVNWNTNTINNQLTIKEAVDMWWWQVRVSQAVTQPTCGALKARYSQTRQHHQSSEELWRQCVSDSTKWKRKKKLQDNLFWFSFYSKVSSRHK